MALLSLLLTSIEHAIVAVVVAMLVSAWSRGGLQGVVDLLMSVLNNLPGYRVIVHSVISGQVKNYTKKLRGDVSTNGTSSPTVPLPERGRVNDDFTIIESTANHISFKTSRYMKF